MRFTLTTLAIVLAVIAVGEAAAVALFGASHIVVPFILANPITVLAAPTVMLLGCVGWTIRIARH